MRILIIAWEIPQFNSRQGKALSIRIGQVISGLCALGHEVLVVHRDQCQEVQQGEVKVDRWDFQGKAIERIVVKEKANSAAYSFLRVAKTYYELLFLGDFSGRWAKYCFKLLKDKIDKADAIVSFFTPRGPLLLGQLLGDYWNIPYFFDFQDEWDRGLRRDQRIVSNIWIKKVCSKASRLVHVSPEWAQRDSKYLKKQFKTLRHAVSNNRIAALPNKDSLFRILYIGSISKDHQDVESFLHAVQKLSIDTDVVFQYAGQPKVDEYLSSKITGIKYEYLGWQEDDALNEYILNSSALLVFGWKSPSRMVVPSKLYYYMSFDKPILIAGKDTGSLASLINDWGHAECIHQNPGQIAKAILEGAKSNFSNYLVPSKCRNVMKVDELVSEYNSIIAKEVERKM